MGTVVEKSKSKLGALELVYAGMFSALMMIGANITSIIPFMVVGGVPITLQTFFAILAGAFLGSRLGAISMTVYAFVGIVGGPVFAGFRGGIGEIISPNFGFILSFILTAYVTGKIIEKNNKLIIYVSAALIGTLVNYLFGTNWMYAAYKLWAAAPDAFSYKVAWMWMAVPFPKDVLLAIFAGLFAYRMQNLIKIRRPA